MNGIPGLSETITVSVAGSVTAPDSAVGTAARLNPRQNRDGYAERAPAETAPLALIEESMLRLMPRRVFRVPQLSYDPSGGKKPHGLAAL